MTDLTRHTPNAGPGNGESRAPMPFEYAESGPPAPGYGGGPRGRQPVDDDVIELTEVIQILRRKMWMILAFLILGGALGWAVHEFREPSYRATAVIMVEDPRGQMSERLAAMDPRGGPSDPIRSAMELLRSRSVLGQIVEEEGLRLRPSGAGNRVPTLAGIQVGEFALPDTVRLAFGEGGVRATSARIGETVEAGYGQTITLGEVAFHVASRPDLPEAELLVVERDRAIERMARALSTQPRPETNVVDVHYTASDPEEAQRVVNRAVMVFRERSTRDARSESQRRRVFLEEQLAQADTSLQFAQASLTEFRSREQVVSSQAQGTAEQTGLMNIEMRREELRADRDMYRSILGTLANATPGEMGERLQAIVASPEVAANPVVSSLHQQLLELEAEREALTGGPWGLSATNPDVARIDQQIATTRGRLEGAVRSHMEALDARLAAMDDLRSRTATQIAARPGSLAEEERLMQDVAFIRRTVEQLQDEYQRARLAEAVEEGPVQVVDLAPLPRDSEQAGLPLMLALGLMLGGMLGAGGAFVLEMLNTKVRRQEDLEQALNVSTVGVIPRLPKTGAVGTLKLAAGAATSGRAAGAGTLPARSQGRPGRHRELVTVHQSRSAEAEAFRTLRTNLLFAQNHEPIRVAVVTSALPGEGKTTTASNLAVTYAQQGLRVLLADADLRKPRVGEVFGMDRKPGLTELVLEEADPARAIRPYDAVDGLWILPSGTLPPNPTELLGGARTRDFLRTLRDRFDMVILDSPPLAGGADAAILGAAADGVIMVVRAGQTEMDAARHAARQLHTVGARLLGTVMNDPDGEAKKYGTYYHSQYYGEAVS
ncbi:MAG: polysaccharide biosynthesis tyrosine autokinase [Gemmatimonadales bacterium]|nr:MAG: polysaccharide biosynthesis tyrosine autokinase [Gemmatimonadales bacterium]